MNRKLDVYAAMLFALAILGSVGILRAQNFVSIPAARATPQVITSHRLLNSMAIVHTVPEYPPIAKINYLEGPVQLEITVNKNGRVSSAHVLDGNPILAAAALKAVMLWVYRPLATQAGPAGFTARVRLKFSLHHPQVELTPRRAEQDFQRQVKPAQVINPANQSQWGDVVRMRLLVNDQGRVVDMDSGRLDNAQREPVLENLRNWTFHPAYWGTIPIPAYLSVDVPVEALPASPVASITATR